MENLTHSLIGVVAGETVARSTQPAEGGLAANTRRGFLVTISVIGNNLPDSDLIVSYSGFTRDKLAYLLQHRGYTHTILGCVVLALLLYGGAELVAKLRRLTLARSDRIAFLCMALFATLLHLAMDSLNSYGVHPFWPFNDRWFYGDAVFIVEPLYWIAAAPMFFLLRTYAARIVLGIALLVALAATTFTHLSRPMFYVAVVVLTAVFLLVSKRATRRVAAWTGAVATLGVTAMFITASLAAADRAEALVARDFPSEQRIDHVLSPGFTNPFCWDALLIQTGGGRYIVRQATLASAPAIVPANHCWGQLTPRVGRTAPTYEVAAPSSAEVVWLNQFSMPADRLASLAAQDCRARELLQFARAPFAAEVDGKWVVGDLRFDNERGLGMSELALDRRGMPTQCRYSVPWVPPRAALLDPPRAGSVE
jgi:inner membrane protein